PTVQLHDCLADVQAHPQSHAAATAADHASAGTTLCCTCPTGLALRRDIRNLGTVGDTIEPLPHALQLTWRQAWATVFYRDPRPPVPRREPDLDWLVARRVFERIGEIIHHDLPNAVGIGHDPHQLGSG